MAKNWTKALLSLAVAGAAIGGAIAYRKYSERLDSDFDDGAEEEDFDLDADLTDSSGREYVTLNIHRDDSSADEPEDTESAQEAPEDTEPAQEAPKETDAETSESDADSDSAEATEI